MAHEVRNPLSAAISACSFVKAAVHEAEPMKDEASTTSVREDTKIIDASLQFINDLLRNMLDMHRASSNQLNIDFAPVDLLRDVLEPVSSMLYARGHDFEVHCECPENTIILTDRLRLKQVCMNLGKCTVVSLDECLTLQQFSRPTTSHFILLNNDVYRTQ